MAIDVVCGMELDEHPPERLNYKGTTYYFCSAACRAEFERMPEDFVDPSETVGGGEASD